MSRSMIKQQNSGATAHVVLYTPRQSTNLKKDSYLVCHGALAWMMPCVVYPKNTAFGLSLYIIIVEYSSS